jgi:hypothetical protein
MPATLNLNEEKQRGMFMVENLEGEIWKEVAGYEGLYAVSNKGRLLCHNYHSTNTDGIIKPYMNENGYCRYTLCKNNKTRRFYAHRLVANAFIENPFDYPCINHKDENPYNNDAENLEWCTYKYNNNYGNHNKNISGKMRNRPEMSRRVAQFTMDGVLVSIYQSSQEAQRNGVFWATGIRNCAEGKYKQHKGYVFKYI